MKKSHSQLSLHRFHTPFTPQASINVIPFQNLIGSAKQTSLQN